MVQIHKQTARPKPSVKPSAAKPAGQTLSTEALAVQALIKDVYDEDDNWIRALLYGESGTGKTTLWGTFPKPILAVVCSGGRHPGELKSLRSPDNKGKIKQFVLEDSSQLLPLIELLYSGEFKTGVVDHVTGLQDLILKEVLGLAEIPQQKSWGLATQQQYGQVTQQCKTYLAKFMSGPYHSVIIGQQRDDSKKKEGTNEELLVPTIGVAASPSLAGWLNPAVDYILQTYKRPRMVEVESEAVPGTKMWQRGEGVDYCLRTAPHDVFTTKFRVPKGYELPEVIVNPTFDKLLAVINGKKKS